MFRQADRSNRRHGVTLIELLLVIGIMVMLLSVAIPLMNWNLQQKKVREAARQLNAVFVGAKARAAEKGIPVGVWFQRPLDRPNECIEVFLAEVPHPYSGDASNARAYVRRNPNLPAPYASSWQVVFDSGNCGTLNASRALIDLNGTFLIKFNYRGPYYAGLRVADPSAPTNPRKDYFVLTSLPNGQPPLGCWLPGDPTDGMTHGWGKDGVDDDGDMAVDELDEMGWPDTSSSAVPPADSFDIPIGLPFQILLNPRKTATAPLDMPAGTAIDLSYSGISASGTDFDAWRASPLTVDGTPVVVMFTPGGQVGGLYMRGTVVEPLGTLYFLIGKNDQIQPLTIGTAGGTVNPRDGVDNNISDLNLLWVTVNIMNGSVATAENYWDPLNPTVDVARRIARSGQAMEGQ